MDNPNPAAKEVANILGKMIEAAKAGPEIKEVDYQTTDGITPEQDEHLVDLLIKSGLFISVISWIYSDGSYRVLAECRQPVMA